MTISQLGNLSNSYTKKDSETFFCTDAVLTSYLLNWYLLTRTKDINALFVLQYFIQLVKRETAASQQFVANVIEKRAIGHSMSQSTTYITSPLLFTLFYIF